MSLVFEMLASGLAANSARPITLRGNEFTGNSSLDSGGGAKIVVARAKVDVGHVQDARHRA